MAMGTADTNEPHFITRVCTKLLHKEIKVYKVLMVVLLLVLSRVYMAFTGV